MPMILLGTRFRDSGPAGLARLINMGGKVGYLEGRVIDPYPFAPYNFAMSRAPILGAPQRVSPHVVPKAKSSSNSAEDDQTAIEPPWEEEASTTVEQGEVAEKIRAIG